MAERNPQDFCGAAPRRIELVYLSSDEEEEMEGLSTTSIMDLQLLSGDEEDDNEIMMMAQCVEMQLSAPIPVLGPSTLEMDCTYLLDKSARYEKPKSRPRPMFLLFGKGKWTDKAR